ncbi:hypothetical protein PBY51_015999 [Eleginops maclovinus]|uniref:Uncharacterized protein n=1 Tax=Eleginops maclovinus TaxID=56733 RepID=A0AAN7XPT9_ELEMC|nr:hypothetical protein PBY51_015999 [Eleginops maclovinus]
MVRAYGLPRVELCEILAPQFYTDGRGARLLLRIHGSAQRPFATVVDPAVRRAPGSAACPLHAVVLLQGPAQQIP